MNRFKLTLGLIFCVTTTASAGDFSHVRSGMLLGVYASDAHNGMRVTGTIPGYTAEGRLFSGDVMLRAATVDSPVIHNLRSHWEIEKAKSAIGANRQAAIEIWRPGTGLVYAWVEFTPVGGPVLMQTINGRQVRSQRATQNRAIFKMESEKPGARNLFQRRTGGLTKSRPKSQPRVGNNPEALETYLIVENELAETQ